MALLSPTRAIPWTLVDGILTLRLNGISMSLTEDHPNFFRILQYLKEHKFRVVESLVYRQETFKTPVELLAEFDPDKESVRELTPDPPKIGGSLPVFFMKRPEITPLSGRVSTVIINSLEDKEGMVQRLYELALQTGKDTFAYQSIEEKFTGDLRVTPSGLVFEYKIKEEDWDPICQIKLVDDTLQTT